MTIGGRQAETRALWLRKPFEKVLKAPYFLACSHFLPIDSASPNFIVIEMSFQMHGKTKVKNKGLSEIMM
jgi:hypothetical protein